MNVTWPWGAALALGVCAGLAACSPELNWREVHLEGLTALLPCKPDAVRRNVPLGSREGAQEVTMDMLGCEVKSALFAISHVRLGDPPAVDAARVQWRHQALSAVQARSVQALPLRLTAPGGSQMARPQSAQRPTQLSTEWVAAQGTRPNGSPVEARLLWLTHGSDLYHVALYADQVSDDMVEMLFSSLALQ